MSGANSADLASEASQAVDRDESNGRGGCCRRAERAAGEESEALDAGRDSITDFHRVAHHMAPAKSSRQALLAEIDIRELT